MFFSFTGKITDYIIFVNYKHFYNTIKASFAKEKKYIIIFRTRIKSIMMWVRKVDFIYKQPIKFALIISTLLPIKSYNF